MHFFCCPVAGASGKAVAVAAAARAPANPRKPCWGWSDTLDCRRSHCTRGRRGRNFSCRRCPCSGRCSPIGPAAKGTVPRNGRCWRSGSWRNRTPGCCWVKRAGQFVSTPGSVPLVPGVLCGCSESHAKCSGCRRARTIGPVDPIRIVVAGVRVDVLDERNDRDIDVAFGLARSRLELGQQALGRKLMSAGILPLSAMEPVLSSTSATRSMLVPHVAVDEPVTVMVL